MPALVVTHTNSEFHCGQATASAAAGRLIVRSNGSTRIEAIWAAAHATWWAVDHGLALVWNHVLERIQEPLR